MRDHGAIKNGTSGQRLATSAMLIATTAICSSQRSRAGG